MKRKLLAASALLVAGMATMPAQAISRYESTRMSCDQAQSAISAEGAVILRYRSSRNPSLPLYDRYVAHGGYCEPNEYAANAYVPTADTRSCYVRVCKDRVDSGSFFR